MASRNCCCCPLTDETLPNITITGFTAGAWSINLTTCCATKRFVRNVEPLATLLDCGDIDFNQEVIGHTVEHWIQTYDLEVDTGTFDGTTWNPPTRRCPPCNDPQLCGTAVFDQTHTKAKRFGVLYQPADIVVTICYREVVCDGNPPEYKYIVSSRWEFYWRSMVQPYERYQTVLDESLSGCCTAGAGFTDYSSTDTFPYSPSEPAFWGLGPYDFGHVYDNSSYFLKYKVFATMPTATTLTFNYNDCPECSDAGIDFDCDLSQICWTATGTSDPGTIDCRAMSVESITCDLPVSRPCNNLWKWPDGEGGWNCQGFLPPTPVATSCGNRTVTYKVLHLTSVPLTLDCSEGPYDPPYYPHVDYAACLYESTENCEETDIRLARSWYNTTRLLRTVTCSGGTTCEVCLPCPSWSVIFP